ncbi:RNA polymerase sigma factor [Xylanimonas ulmi]|uniref:RNA polymerase sigma factor n=1 Tax=Xylanimonas ulmi TaxID=228973 RepID=UPI0013EEC7DC|nr:sigma-70 family RNA polymerase sigma factor [Xylanibacterium ulmi]
MSTGAPAPDFGAVFRAHYPGVLAYLRRRVPPSDAEDLAAEVFAIAWDRWDAVPHEVRPWLFGVARNVAAGHARATGRRQRLELRAQRERDLPDDGGHGLATVSLDLRLAWSRLSDADREAIALVAWDGLTGAEAAAVLGCTRAAFSVRLSRARRRLSRLLDDVDLDPDAEPASCPAPSPFPSTAPVFSPGGLS